MERRRCEDEPGSRPRRALVALAGVVALEAGGCVYPATEVLVRVDTDVPTDVALEIVATVRRTSTTDGAVIGPDETPDLHFARLTSDAGPDAGARLPASFAIVPRHGARDERVTLVVEGRAGAAFTLRRVARFAFVSGSTVTLSIFLSAQCLAPAPAPCAGGATCTLQTYCEERGQTCGEHGVCVAPDVSLDPQASRDGAAGMDAAQDTSASCPAGRTRCNGARVDLATDSANCGGCGVACPSQCSGGVCPSCGSPGQGCCGSACGPGATCIGGGCLACGGSGQLCCDGGGCAAGTVCNGSVCLECGGAGERCCANGACGGGAFCGNDGVNSYCCMANLNAPCGANNGGYPCCPSAGLVCPPEGHCCWPDGHPCTAGGGNCCSTYCGSGGQCCRAPGWACNGTTNVCCGNYHCGAAGTCVPD